MNVKKDKTVQVYAAKQDERRNPPSIQGLYIQVRKRENTATSNRHRVVSGAHGPSIVLAAQWGIAAVETGGRPNQPKQRFGLSKRDARTPGSMLKKEGSKVAGRETAVISPSK